MSFYCFCFQIVYLYLAIGDHCWWIILVLLVSIVVVVVVVFVVPSSLLWMLLLLRANRVGTKQERVVVVGIIDTIIRILSLLFSISTTIIIIASATTRRATQKSSPTTRTNHRNQEARQKPLAPSPSGYRRCEQAPNVFDNPAIEFLGRHHHDSTSSMEARCLSLSMICRKKKNACVQFSL